MPSLFRFLTVVAHHRRDRLWRGFRAGEFRQSEAAGNDRHHPAGQVPQEIGARVWRMRLRRRPQTPKLINLFLDMLAAEQGAGDNTLDAYRRDLTDFSEFLGRSRPELCRRRNPDAARLSRRSRHARLQIVERGAAAVGDAASVSLPAQRADPQRRSRRDPVGPEARPRPAEGAVDSRRRPHADARQGADAGARTASAVAAASRAAAVLPAGSALRHRLARLRTGGAAAARRRGATPA